MTGQKLFQDMNTEKARCAGQEHISDIPRFYLIYIFAPVVFQGLGQILFIFMLFFICRYIKGYALLTELFLNKLCKFFHGGMLKNILKYYGKIVGHCCHHQSCRGKRRSAQLKEALIDTNIVKIQSPFEKGKKSLLHFCFRFSELFVPSVCFYLGK